MSHVLRAIGTSVAGAILALCARDVNAKIDHISLRELVKKSSTIVLGRVQASDSDRGEGQWVPFSSSQVFKGDSTLAGRTIQLCNSPRSIGEYPRVSTWTYDVILFLVEEKSGCFEFSYRTESVVADYDGKVVTAAILDQPLEQSPGEFIKKLQKLVAEKTSTSD